jgi:hypothetical protein
MLVPRSVLRWTIDGVLSEITVTYARSDQSPDLWVPTTMRETYTTPSRKFECVTTYTRFRRFEVS